MLFRVNSETLKLEEVRRKNSMDEEMKKMLEDIIKDIDPEFVLEVTEDVNEDLTRWFIIGVNAFINAWVKTNLNNPDVEFIENEPVKTLDYVNRIYSWQIKAKDALIMIAFNDLDYSFNSLVSFDRLDPENPGSYFKRESECDTFENCLKFIVTNISKYYKEN